MINHMLYITVYLQQYAMQNIQNIQYVWPFSRKWEYTEHKMRKKKKHSGKTQR